MRTAPSTEARGPGGTQQDAPEVSFVVIAYNEAPNIERTLRSISAQTGTAGGYEVLVVDDASRDGTADVAEAYSAGDDPNVRVVRLAKNGGRGHARFVGVREAEGRLLATVDADIVLPPDWLTRCRTALAESDAVCGIAVPDGDVQYLYKRFRFEPRPLPATIDVTGNNALYRAEVFERASFDPDLREGEDVALNHAMRAADARIATIDDLYVRHEESKDFRASLSWLFESGMGATRQLRRYREVRPPDVVFGAWLGTVAAAAMLGPRVSKTAWALPFALTAAAAAGHVNQKFVLDPKRPGAAAGAVAADAVLLGAYFLGRVAGLARR